MSAYYLNKAQFKAELDRCLQCVNKPCTKACPVNCQPQEFIKQAKRGDLTGAAQTIMQNNPLGQTCGLICPDKFCLKACLRAKIDFAVNIPKIQATLLENCETRTLSPSISHNQYKIAVIGAGPAGLAATDVLSRAGYFVHVFEATDKIGGALNMIPVERLPHQVIEKDASFILCRPNVQIMYNHKIQSPLQLLDDFDGIIVATGEPTITPLAIEGQEYALSYTEYLLNPNTYRTTGKVAVIGGGNVAADCALTAHRNGSRHVEMFVRRRLCDMRISQSEYLSLLQNEINITALSSPEKIVQAKEGLTLFIHKNQCVDNHWQCIPETAVALKGFTYVISAIGSRAEPKVIHDRIIYAGDCKTGGSTVVEAIALGREAAHILQKKSEAWRR